MLNPKKAQTFWRNVVHIGVDSNEDRVVCISCSNQSLYLEGEHLVCKCPPASEEGEQDDLGTKEQAR